jgi:hypothetical protein
MNNSFFRVLDEISKDVRFELLHGNAIKFTLPVSAAGFVPIRRLSPEVLEELRTGTSLATVGHRVLRNRMRSCLTESLRDLKSAERTESTMFSASRLDLLAIRALEQAGSLQDSMAWDQAASIQIPWIERLSVEEVCRLRDDAPEALPRFRERLRRAAAGTSDAKEVANVIQALREEAVEVSAELSALSLGGRKKLEAVGGALGLTVCLLGIGGIIPPGVSLSALVSLLGLLHVPARKEAQEAAKLRSRPGYVLLKAKELGGHGKPPARGSQKRRSRTR